jgi:hypothetical protein
MLELKKSMKLFKEQIEIRHQVLGRMPRAQWLALALFADACDLPNGPVCAKYVSNILSATRELRVNQTGRAQETDIARG